MSAAFLFLDFDGVMHRAHVGTNIDRLFEHADLLASWMGEHPTVQIVVSSSWREVHPLSQLRDLLFHDKPDLAERVVGATPNLDRQKLERSAECRHWLADQGHYYAAWVAIDDQAELFDRFSRANLVLCDPAVGLTLALLDRAWQLLQRLEQEEPERRTRRDANGAPLSPSQRAFVRPLPVDHPSAVGKEPGIKPLTKLEEARIVREHVR